jgi:hypothetical protein
MSVKQQMPAGGQALGSPLSRAMTVVRAVTLLAIVAATILLLGQWLLS